MKILLLKINIQFMGKWKHGQSSNKSSSWFEPSNLYIYFPVIQKSVLSQANKEIVKCAPQTATSFTCAIAPALSEQKKLWYV